MNRPAAVGGRATANRLRETSGRNGRQQQQQYASGVLPETAEETAAREAAEQARAAAAAVAAAQADTQGEVSGVTDDKVLAALGDLSRGFENLCICVLLRKNCILFVNVWFLPSSYYCTCLVVHNVHEDACLHTFLANLYISLVCMQIMPISDLARPCHVVEVCKFCIQTRKYSVYFYAISLGEKKFRSVLSGKYAKSMQRTKLHCQF